MGAGVMGRRSTGQAVTRDAGAATAVALLPRDERSPCLARRFLRQRIAAWGLPEEAAATAELCLSEVVTNAVVHAASPAQLRVTRSAGTLEVRVRDHGGPPRGHLLATPVAEDGEELSVHGRGLMLIDSLASAWGVDARADGTCVWFRIDLAPAG